MLDVNENDLKLSPTFHKANEEIAQLRTKLVQEHKQANSDTIEACLLFTTNIEHFKTLIKSSPKSDEADLIVNDLLKTFPKLEKKYIIKELNKHFIFTYQQVNKFFLLICSIIFIIALNVLIITSVSFSTLISILGVLTSIFIAIYLVIDVAWFSSK